jgi:hypothetical protein
MKISIMTPRKKKISILFFHHSLAKTCLLKYFQENLRIFKFQLTMKKKYENSLTKNYRYVDAPRDKTVKARRRIKRRSGS